MIASRACAIALTIAASVTASSVAATSNPEQFDATVIEMLRAHGSDLSKPHDIDFIFLFESERQANAAAKELRSLGHEVRSIRVTPDGQEWVVQTGQKLVPSKETMQAATRKLTAIAKSHGGQYDGWGTKGQSK